MKIEIKDLTKKFNEIVVLNNISITFEEGKIYGLVGRNGSGKSVLLKLICGFYVPTSGKIIIDGIDIVKERTFLNNTRALIEHPSFLDDLSGFDNLRLLAKIQNRISEEQILSTIYNVNLDKYKDKKYSTYSLGMKQKLGIAQVLMEDPKIMIFDEPFNGIEEETAKKIRTILRDLKKQGKIIIIASHIKEDIEGLSDEIYYFDDGNVRKIEKND